MHIVLRFLHNHQHNNGRTTNLGTFFNLATIYPCARVNAEIDFRIRIDTNDLFTPSKTYAAQLLRECWRVRLGEGTASGLRFIRERV